MIRCTTGQRRRAAVLFACLAGLLLFLPSGSANAAQPRAFPGFDCTQAPTPDMPGQGLASFFERTPKPLPKPGDPFARHPTTTIYQQYGFAGLRWHTYDLGCGPDTARNPDAVIGTAMANWVMNLPIAVTALTSSLTEVAFHPTFLDVFDPVISRVSAALHRSLFATWVPAVLALLGILILLKARRASLATTAAAIGWALMVVIVATAIFRWPLQAGHFADGSVTGTLGSVVNDLDGSGKKVDPGVAVGSNVQRSIFYRSWLAGTLGSTDSQTARKYGPALFEAQALTWRQASIVEHNPERGQQIISAKQDRWKQIAEQIKNTDPEAYENLTGKRSDTRLGYAFLSALGAVLALPFLLVSALLLLGSFLIVRLAVMMFPAFATLGVFPAGRAVVIGIARTVGAALVNAVIFGVGAAVTIRVLGLILDPASKLPGWLSLVLMPLFGFIMWVALKPFRRLTTMINPSHDPFGEAAGSLGNAAHSGSRWAKKAAATAVGVYTGNVAAAATAEHLGEKEANAEPPVPERAEARPAHAGAPAIAPIAAAPAPSRALPAAAVPAEPTPRTTPSGTGPGGPTAPSQPWQEPSYAQPTSEGVPLPPTEPEWHDGEEVYAIYRPIDDNDHNADDAA